MAARQAEDESRSVNNPASRQWQPRRYEIEVRGQLGPTMLEALPAFTARVHGRDTVLSRTLPDPAALYGVLHQIEALGLELLEVRCRPLGATLTDDSHDVPAPSTESEES